jgi:hypothetical protein
MDQLRPRASARAPDYSHISDRIGKLPQADRIEVVGQAAALAGGVEAKRLNPLAGDLYDSGLSAAALVRALGVNGSAGLFTSADLMEATRQSLVLVVDSLMEAIRPEHWSIVGRIDAQDLRDVVLPQLTEGWVFELDSELQEIPSTSIKVHGETIQMKAFGSIANMTRQAVINGEFSVMAAHTRELVNACYRRERSAVIAALIDGRLMADGLPLFHADRGNLVGTDDILDVWQKYRELTGANGEYLTLPVGAVIASPRRVFVNAVITQDLLPGLTVFDDPRLTTTIVMPPPKVAPVIGLATMSEQPEIVIKRVGDNWGVRVLHWFGAGPVSAHAASGTA